MSHIIISSVEDFNQKKVKVLKGGFGKLHVLADFDRTLTYAHRENGSFIPSVISILRDEEYISQDYSSKAHELFDKYHPIEMDPSINNKEKSKAMNEWWTKHFDLLANSGFNEHHLKRVVDSGIIRLREGVKEFLALMHKKDVPVIILSAQGIGNTISMILEKEKVLFDNITIITNIFNFDNTGKVVNGPKFTIHSMNKGEEAIRDKPIFNTLKERKNVILMGDGLGDVDMIKGFDYDVLLKFGFLNQDYDDKTLKAYQENFDVIITKDSSIKEINDILGEIHG